MRESGGREEVVRMQNVAEYIGVAGVFLVIALVEGTKQVWPALESRFWPLVALIWAVLINVGAALVMLRVGTAQGPPEAALFEAVIIALVVAVSSMGLYSGSKAALGKS
jgi:hypothetical protein